MRYVDSCHHSPPELRLAAAASGAGMNEGVFLHNVGKRYSSFSLQHVSFSLAPGDVLGVKGPNGSGKSTLLHLMSGFIAPDTGTVSINGHSAQSRYAKAHIGFVGDCAQFPKQFSIQQCAKIISCWYKTWDWNYFDMLLNTFEIYGSAVLQNCSTGMRKKAGLALALPAATKLLILDEATSDLDEASRQTLYEVLTRHMSNSPCDYLVFASHINDDYRLCNKTITLSNGAVAAHSLP